MFKRIKIFALAVVLLIFFAPQLVSAEQIIIFHTNDMHCRILRDDDDGKSIGLAEITAAVRKTKNAFWFDAGDTFHGIPNINISRGENLIPILNAAGIDLMVPGNHDFNYGSDQLEKLAKKLKFPILAANVTRKSTGAEIFPAYKIFKRQNIKIGVFGLATPETAFMTSPAAVSTINFLNPVETARRMVGILRPQCDVVVAVMHMGLKERSEFKSSRIAAEVPGIDVIIDGHSHTELPQGLQVGETLIAQTGCYEHFLGQVTINLRDGKITSKTAKLLSAADVEKINPTPDKKVAAQVQKLEKKTEELLNQFVIHNDKKLSADRNIIRRRESEIGNLVADALRRKAGTEIAVVNAGGIRADLPAGDVTNGDVLKVLAMGNTNQAVEIDGKTIRAMLEHSVAVTPETFSGYLDVSGMTFTFDSSKPAGQRVEEIYIGGAPLDENRIYTMAASSFLILGGNNYDMLKGLKFIGEYSTMDDSLLEYLKEVGLKGYELGRIKDLADGAERQAA